MNTSSTISRFGIAVMLLLGMFSASEAQELAKIKDDYCGPFCRQYQPDDPWTRSRIWNRHTGHWGRFYNCDGEECKRNSPWICWKHGPDPWPRDSFVRHLHRTKLRIRQRIADGSCQCCESRDSCESCIPASRVGRIASDQREKRSMGKPTQYR